jgi:hypothetical protein
VLICNIFGESVVQSEFYASRSLKNRLGGKARARRKLKGIATVLFDGRIKMA